jgi:hypothetical protein
MEWRNYSQILAVMVRMDKPFSTSKKLQVQNPSSRGTDAKRIEDILLGSETNSALQKAYRTST